MPAVPADVWIFAHRPLGPLATQASPDSRTGPIDSTGILRLSAVDTRVRIGAIAPCFPLALGACAGEQSVLIETARPLRNGVVDTGVGINTLAVGAPATAYADSVVPGPQIEAAGRLLQDAILANAIWTVAT